MDNPANNSEPVISHEVHPPIADETIAYVRKSPATGARIWTAVGFLLAAVALVGAIVASQEITRRQTVESQAAELTK